MFSTIYPNAVPCELTMNGITYFLMIDGDTIVGAYNGRMYDVDTFRRCQVAMLDFDEQDDTHDADGIPVEDFAWEDMNSEFASEVIAAYRNR